MDVQWSHVGEHDGDGEAHHIDESHARGQDAESGGHEHRKDAEDEQDTQEGLDDGFHDGVLWFDRI